LANSRLLHQHDAGFFVGLGSFPDVPTYKRLLQFMPQGYPVAASTVRIAMDQPHDEHPEWEKRHEEVYIRYHA
jgi:hypothetical protein